MPDAASCSTGDLEKEEDGCRGHLNCMDPPHSSEPNSQNPKTQIPFLELSGTLFCSLSVGTGVKVGIKLELISVWQNQRQFEPVTAPFLPGISKGVPPSLPSGLSEAKGTEGTLQFSTFPWAGGDPQGPAHLQHPVFQASSSLC